MNQDQARKMAEELGRHVIPDAVVFADQPEHVEAMRRRAAGLIYDSFLQFAQEREVTGGSASEKANQIAAWFYGLSDEDSSIKPSKEVLASAITKAMQERESEAVRELVEGLRPFAAIGDQLSRNLKDNDINPMLWAVPEVGAFRQAAALIANFRALKVTKESEAGDEEMSVLIERLTSGRNRESEAVEVLTGLSLAVRNLGERTDGGVTHFEASPTLNPETYRRWVALDAAMKKAAALIAKHSRKV